MEEFDSFYLGVLIIPFFLGLTLYYFSLNRKHKKPIVYILFCNIIFTLLLISIVFLGGETYYRFFVDRTQGFGGVKLNERWGRRHYTFNNFRIRDNQDYFPKINPSKKQRISFLGDSFTEGLGIKNVDDRFTNIIRNTFPQWEIHCLAKRGRDTHSEYLFLDFARKNNYQFDYVVLCYCLNDIDYLVPEMKLIDKDANKSIKEAGYLEKNSYFIDTFIGNLKPSLSKNISNYYQYLQATYSNDIWKTQADSLKAISRLVEKNGGKLIAVSFPFLNTPWNQYQFEFVHKRLDSLWKSINVPHLDLLPEFKNHPAEKLVVNKFDAHPNELADSIAAKLIAKFLDANINNTNSYKK